MNGNYLIPILLFSLDFIIKAVLLFVVPRDRKPTAAIAWLLAIFLLPGLIGLVLFLFIGSTEPSKLRRRRQAQIDKAIRTNELTHPVDVPTSIAPFVNLNQSLSKLPATTGVISDILTDYLKTVKYMTADIEHAKYYVYIEIFILAYDDVTSPLFEALDRAVQRGVKVYILFDAIGSRKYKNFKQMKKWLDARDISWRPMLPIRLFSKNYNRPDLRNHRKLIAIDNSIAYIGSLNLIDPRYERKDDIIYEELVARIEGDIAVHVGAIIGGDWFSETDQIIDEFLLTKIPARKKSQPIMQLIPSGPAFANENNLKLFLQLIYSAKRTVVITNPYLVPTEPLLNALITAAKRGVSVKIINSEAIDQMMVGHAQRSYYEELLKVGVEIYLHKAPVLLHSKHMTIDEDIAMIGSSNMDVRSFELNYECVLVVFDKKVVKQLEKIQRKNLAHATKLTLVEWKKRRLFALFLDGLFRLTSAVQ